MKKLRIAVAALVIAAGSFATFAFTDANNSDNDKTEFLNVYHYVSTDANGKINFALGEPDAGDCPDEGSTPCRFTSNSTLTSPMTPADIQSNATVTNWRE